MKVPFVQYGKSYTDHVRDIDKAIKKTLKSGKLILQEDVEQFEENLAKFVGTKYAVALNSGTDALFLSLKLSGIKEGDEVITVGHTFHATVEAVVHCGAIPVLVDVGPDSLMDVDRITNLLTYKTKAIIPVHLMGDMVDVKKIRSLLDENDRNDVFIIEDACQALGSERDGKKAGSWGLTGCFSFYPAKILGAFGDAGAVTTDSEYISKELKDLRNHYKFNPGKYGYNSRLDNLHAAILNVKFKYLKEYLKKRGEVANIYNKELSGIADLTLPVNRKGRVWQDYIIRVPNRSDLMEYLERNGIQTMKNDYHFPHDLPKPKNTILLEKETLRIPCNPEMTIKQSEYVAKVIREFYGV